jgi:hypothetical protein
MQIVLVKADKMAVMPSKSTPKYTVVVPAFK